MDFLYSVVVEVRQLSSLGGAASGGDGGGGGDGGVGGGCSGQHVEN